jgi:hypothetical protein
LDWRGTGAAEHIGLNPIGSVGFACLVQHTLHIAVSVFTLQSQDVMASLGWLATPGTAQFRQMVLRRSRAGTLRYRDLHSIVPDDRRFALLARVKDLF